MEDHGPGECLTDRQKAVLLAAVRRMLPLFTPIKKPDGEFHAVTDITYPEAKSVTKAELDALVEVLAS